MCLVCFVVSLAKWCMDEAGYARPRAILRMAISKVDELWEVSHISDLFLQGSPIIHDLRPGSQLMSILAPGIIVSSKSFCGISFLALTLSPSPGSAVKVSLPQRLDIPGKHTMINVQQRCIYAWDGADLGRGVAKQDVCNPGSCSQPCGRNQCHHAYVWKTIAHACLPSASSSTPSLAEARRCRQGKDGEVA
jgi:hypothetical protein